MPAHPPAAPAAIPPRAAAPTARARLGRACYAAGVNEYKGSPIALWVFAAMTLVTVGRSLAHVLLPDGGAQSIATIPLSDFTPNGAAALIHIFAEWGWSQLVFGLFYVIVLVRYRSLIPLMWTFILLEYAGRLALGFAKPFEVAGTAPGAVGNYVFVPLALVMLVLSLRKREA